ncbi:hypothetical protein [Paracoccus fistulariae]|uniref:hypothetical protein n=1 Tax=Paracoccus fistulariae TaxID=658446 RepID=UPI00232B1D76|nr:hypothetical protein [Paracoccus fistulariae]MDB6182800.1 hypothetical protein [Paracoccus fistulariae]
MSKNFYNTLEQRAKRFDDFIARLLRLLAIAALSATLFAFIQTLPSDSSRDKIIYSVLLLSLCIPSVLAIIQLWFLMSFWLPDLKIVWHFILFFFVFVLFLFFVSIAFLQPVALLIGATQ